MHACHCKYIEDFQNLNNSTGGRVVSGQRPISTRSCAILFKRYQGELFRRCMYRLGNTADAEDAVQETLFRAYKAIGQFEGRSSFKAWLYAIADNQCNTIARRRLRYVLSEQVRAMIEIQERSCRYQEAFEDSAEVTRVLNDTPAKNRQILKMRFYSELSLEEIARHLGIGLSAAKMRLYRALEMFEHQYRESIASGTQKPAV